MATEKPRPLLLQELAVAHDERHSYMQRMYSLAGPGAYTIPSTFRRPAPNMLLRVVQRENYGREYSRQKRVLPAATSVAIEETPCQLCLVTAPDTHRDRRDQLRKLLHLAPVRAIALASSALELELTSLALLVFGFLLQVDRWDDAAPKSAIEQSPRAVANNPRAAWPDDQARRSPISRASNSPSCRRKASTDLADIVADFGEQPPAEEVARVQRQQLCCYRAPLSYQHFLMSTSYLDRLKRLQQRAASH
ncbi:hypothetical protein PRNP1_011496 [Phytophthora ramorum]